MPKVSVVMPVYNRQKYIKSSVESILNQTFTDFEFIIVNDGSTDKTLEILKSYTDKRIKIIENEKNSGIVFSRNRGLNNATGQYIAMMDSDDIAYSNKLMKQVDFLDKNKEYGMVGTWVKFIDENSKYTGGKWKLPAKPDLIPPIMLFRNYFVQSTILVRREAIPEWKYSPEFEIVEDSKMWFEVSLNYKVLNLQEYLLDYRVHSDNITNTGHSKQMANSRKLYKLIFKNLDINITEKELDLHILIKNSNKISNIEELKNIENWLIKIINQNKKIQLYNEKKLRKIIRNRWLKVCSKSNFIGIIYGMCKILKF